VAQKLIREGKARKVMVIDLDQHEGNGTAACVLGDNRIWNVSLYGSNMGGPPASANNHVLQVKHTALGKGATRDANYLATVSEKLPALLRQHDPDLILYQAGMDPYDCSGVTEQALAVRDAYVFSLARAAGKPLTWVLAGGYSDLATLQKLHTNTVRAASSVLEKVKTGDRVCLSGREAYSWSTASGTVSFPDWKTLLGGECKTKPPRVLDEAGTRAFVSAREQLKQQQRLPDAEMQAAYRSLFSSTPPSSR